ncbi:hypothetical protein NQZ68_026171 [Dissostichus eleginoides]|nr:hypothetical protein NQZ68_026171 [Dissostichus eleginoides]
MEELLPRVKGEEESGELLGGFDHCGPRGSLSILTLADIVTEVRGGTQSESISDWMIQTVSVAMDFRSINNSLENALASMSSPPPPPRTPALPQGESQPEFTLCSPPATF